MHEQFGVTWGDPVLYDLVLNTDRLSVDSCVEQIRAAGAPGPSSPRRDASRALLADMALEARVRVALQDDAATRDIDVTIDASDGHGHAARHRGQRRGAAAGRERRAVASPA